jgi:hypothetical protein
MFMSHRQNAGQNDNDLKISDIFFENVAELKYVAVALRNKKLH